MLRLDEVMLILDDEEPEAAAAAQKFKPQRLSITSFFFLFSFLVFPFFSFIFFERSNNRTSGVRFPEPKSMSAVKERESKWEKRVLARKNKTN